jgi:hypothetical protein
MSFFWKIEELAIFNLAFICVQPPRSLNSYSLILTSISLSPSVCFSDHHLAPYIYGDALPSSYGLILPTLQRKPFLV